MRVTPTGDAMKILHLAVAAACAAALPAAAAAQAWPSRPITVVVGYPPGGSTDLTGRVVAQELASALQATVIVENAAGAGGSLAASRVAKAAPDGYTLMVASNNELVINQHINKEVKYDGRTDFQPIGLIASQPLVLVASPKAGVRTAADFVEAVRSHPGKFSYGSAGVGTSLHLLGELVKDKARLDLVHVPYKGAAPMTSDLLGGVIEYGVFVLSSGLPHIRAGKVVPIGVSERRRSSIAPEIPTLAEHPALRGIDVGAWFVLAGPVGLPPAVVERLRAALDTALKSPALRRKLEAAGSTVVERQPDLARFIAEESAKAKHMVDLAGVKP
jgi:tripartite-type tricarboxylate transporter receptor subunit TctC